MDCTANKKAKRLLSDATCNAASAAMSNFSKLACTSPASGGTSAHELGLAAAAASIQNAMKLYPDLDLAMLLKEAAHLNASSLCKTSPIASSLISNEVSIDVCLLFGKRTTLKLRLSALYFAIILFNRL